MSAQTPVQENSASDGQTGLAGQRNGASVSDQSQIQQNKALILHLVEECLNKRDLSIIDEFYAPNMISYDPEQIEATHTLDEIKRGTARSLYEVFPNGRYTTQELIAEGDKVVWRWEFQATHLGRLTEGSPPPTGRQILLDGVTIFRIANGKIVEDRVYRNTIGFLRRLGMTDGKTIRGRIYESTADMLRLLGVLPQPAL